MNFFAETSGIGGVSHGGVGVIDITLDVACVAALSQDMAHAGGFVSELTLTLSCNRRIYPLHIFVGLWLSPKPLSITRRVVHESLRRLVQEFGESPVRMSPEGT